MTVTNTPTGKQISGYGVVKAKAAYDLLNEALTAAGLNFQVSTFDVVEGRGHPTFSIQLTAMQANRLAAKLAPFGTMLDRAGALIDAEGMDITQPNVKAIKLIWKGLAVSLREAKNLHDVLRDVRGYSDRVQEAE